MYKDNYAIDFDGGECVAGCLVWSGQWWWESWKALPGKSQQSWKLGKEARLLGTIPGRRKSVHRAVREHCMLGLGTSC